MNSRHRSLVIAFPLLIVVLSGQIQANEVPWYEKPGPSVVTESEDSDFVKPLPRPKVPQQSTPARQPDRTATPHQEQERKIIPPRSIAPSIIEDAPTPPHPAIQPGTAPGVMSRPDLEPGPAPEERPWYQLPNKNVLQQNDKPISIGTLGTFGEPEYQIPEGPANGRLPGGQSAPVHPSLRIPETVQDSRKEGQSPVWRNWTELWRDVWNFSNALFDINAAPTVSHVPQCQGVLGLGTLVENTIHAVNGRRYGDAVKLFGQFQDSLQCVTQDGAYGLDFALSIFIHLAINELDDGQQRIAVNGAFNLGMLAFDQIQYTGHNWWLPVMHTQNEAVLRHIRAGYDGRELGLWFYDIPAAVLIYHGFDARQAGSEPLTRSMFEAFKNPDRFANGECDLLAMVDFDFRCTKDAASVVGSGRDGSAGLPPGSRIPEHAACVIDAAMSKGPRGFLSCMARAHGKGEIPTINLEGEPIIRGVLDNECTLMQASGTKRDPREALGWMRSVCKVAGGVNVVDISGGCEYVVDQIENLDKTWFQRNREFAEHTDADRITADRARTREEEAKKRRGEQTPDPENPMDNCTNASQRIATMFACMDAAGMSEPNPVRTRGDEPRPTDPDGPRPSGPGVLGGEYGTSSILYCSLQGGALVRGDYHDPRCELMMCTPDMDSCPCNGPGGEGPVIGASAQSEINWFRGRGYGYTDWGPWLPGEENPRPQEGSPLGPGLPGKTPFGGFGDGPSGDISPIGAN
jgi:hypothetical protein